MGDPTTKVTTSRGGRRDSSQQLIELVTPVSRKAQPARDESHRFPFVLADHLERALPPLLLDGEPELEQHRDWIDGSVRITAGSTLNKPTTRRSAELP